LTRPDSSAEAGRVQRAAAYLSERLGVTPAVTIVLGSGLGGLVDAIEDPVRVDYGEIPDFPAVTVAGHGGRLVAGRFAGLTIMAMQGRFHLYEGHSPDAVARPVRVSARMGVPDLIVTNSAGGINRQFSPGDLMLIDDHINLMGSNPLVGGVQPGELRFPDMSAPYDRALLDLAEKSALAEGIRVHRGVYCALHGPSYETPAEVRMLQRLGADAVGMSTVPEVLAARAAGVRVLGISIISNAAAGLSAGHLDHAEVLEAGREAGGRLTRLIERTLRGMRV